MIKTFVNAWKVADIRKKLLFTAFVILVFRIGSVIPVPFLNIVDEINVGKGNTILTYLSLMTGSAFTYGTIFAMSITPYINASIIMQLLAVAIPALERLQKEGEEGRKKIGTITRFVTVGLGLLQSLAYFFFLRANGYLMKDASGAAFTGFDAVFQAVVIIAVLTAGTAVIMWLGEQITIPVLVTVFPLSFCRHRVSFPHPDQAAVPVPGHRPYRLQSSGSRGVRDLPFDDRLHRIYG